MMKLNKFCISTLIIIAFALLPQAADAAIFEPEDNAYGTPITVHVDGKYIASDVEPMMSSNRVFLPMRAAAEEMGATVKWDNASRCAIMTKDGITVQFFVDSNTYYVNGYAYVNDVTPMIINDRTMLPIRVFAESLGAQVEWNQDMLDVQIYTGAEVIYPPSIPSDIPVELHKAIQKYYVEPTKTGIGSWYCKYETISDEMVCELNFISERSDGSRQCIEFWAKDATRDNHIDFFNIYKHTALDFGDHCIISSLGSQDHIYESDTFPIGSTFYPASVDYISYGNSQDPQGLYRNSRNGAGVIAEGNSIFLSF